MTITPAEFLRLVAAATSAASLSTMAQTSDTRMLTRKIPSTGAALPVIGCGTWQTFDAGDERKPQLAQVLSALFAAGGSVIDSSPMYGRSEAVVGDLLAQSGERARAFIATKVWTTGRQAGIDQMQRSMVLLRTDRLELMQIHNLVDWRTHLATLRAWKKDGRIRYLGITHFTPGAHDDLAAIMRTEALDFVQLNYALDDRAAERRLLPLAAERGIAVLVNQPFGGGGLIRKLSQRPLPEWASDADCKSWAQILLKFILAQPAVTCVIPGTSRPEHMRDNTAAGIGRLPDAALLKRIAAVLD